MKRSPSLGVVSPSHPSSPRTPAKRKKENHDSNSPRTPTVKEKTSDSKSQLEATVQQLQSRNDVLTKQLEEEEEERADIEEELAELTDVATSLREELSAKEEQKMKTDADLLRFSAQVAVSVHHAQEIRNAYNTAQQSAEASRTSLAASQELWGREKAILVDSLSMMQKVVADHLRAMKHVGSLCRQAASPGQGGVHLEVKVLNEVESVCSTEARVQSELLEMVSQLHREKEQQRWRAVRGDET